VAAAADRTEQTIDGLLADDFVTSLTAMTSASASQKISRHGSSAQRCSLRRCHRSHTTADGAKSLCAENARQPMAKSHRITEHLVSNMSTYENGSGRLLAVAFSDVAVSRLFVSEIISHQNGFY
jgi:hypothetical protein